VHDAEPQPPPDVEVDACGLTCPMPLLKAKKALNAMAGGQVLRVLATDPGSERDFQVFARQSGHPLLASRRDGDRFVYLLEKRETP
jgi:tRNA 2-thiouridine synthesizing protein A